METKSKIIAELEKNQSGIHLRGLSRLVNSGLPNVKRFLMILEKEGVVRKEKEANLIRFKLHTFPGKVHAAINEFLEELEIKPLIALIFGSYAKGNFTKESDIDILLVFQKLENVKEIENTAKRISMRTNTKISPVYVNYNNFERNFLNKNHDFSKEIRQDVIIILGIEYYYSLLWRFLK